MRYELWHVETANLMDDFESEAEAFDVARAYLTPDSRGATVEVALVAYDDAGNISRSLSSTDLSNLLLSRPASEAH